MALEFLSGDNVNFGSSSTLDDVIPYTWIVWFRFTNIPSAYGGLVCKGSPSGYTLEKYIGLASDGTIEYQNTRATGGALVQSSTVFSAGRWYQLALTFESSAVKCFYKDFTDTNPIAEVAYNSQDAGSGTPTTDASYDFWVGNRKNDSGKHLDGYIACVQMYDRVLSLAELQILTYHPQSLSGCLLNAQLGFPNTTCIDLSGNGLTGTNTGAVYAPHIPFKPLFGVRSGYQGNISAAASAIPNKIIKPSSQSIIRASRW